MSEVPDLMAALIRSVERAKQDRRDANTTPQPEATRPEASEQGASK